MSTPTEESSERLDPALTPGRLIVAEHRARYLWAAQLACGRSVLDAGCGTGYGTVVLSAAGASRVHAVDLSAEAVEQASQTLRGAQASVRQADLRELPFADGEFSLVVCFEVIEHVEERGAILDELARVTAPDGVLCVSTPNRGVYPPGNPFHVHEYEPDELARDLRERFARVELQRQTAWLASAVLSESQLAAAGAAEGFASRVVKTEQRLPGEETFTVALAGDGALPAVEPILTLADGFEARWWQREAEGAERRAAAAALRAASEAAEARERAREAADRLLVAETVNTQLNSRIYRLEDELAARAERLHEAEQEMRGALARAEHAERVSAGMKSSWSWKLTAPLRGLTRRGRR